MSAELGGSQISSLLEALPGIASVLRSPVADALVKAIRAAAGVGEFTFDDAEELVRYAVRRGRPRGPRARPRPAARAPRCRRAGGGGATPRGPPRPPHPPRAPAPDGGGRGGAGGDGPAPPPRRGGANGPRGSQHSRPPSFF